MSSFEELEEKFPEIVDMMPNEFDSYNFLNRPIEEE